MWLLHSGGHQQFVPQSGQDVSLNFCNISKHLMENIQQKQPEVVARQRDNLDHKIGQI